MLVPETSAERDRYRKSGAGRVALLFVAIFRRFSREGLHFVGLAFLTALFALDVFRTQLYVAWGALAGLLFASFAASFLYRLKGVRVHALVARRIARGAKVPLTVRIESDAEEPYVSLRVRGPFLPWDGRWSKRALTVPRLEAHAHALVELEASFHRRGEHHLDPFTVQALVPFGLSLGPPRVTEAPRFLVVPPIVPIASLSIPRSRRHHPGGIPRAVHTADSRELAGVRPYRPGDAVRDLHARTWARTGVAHVREYQEEYFSHVAVVVDAAAVDAPVRRGRRRRRFDEDTALEASLSLASGVIAKLLGGEALIDLWVIGEDRGVSALGRGRGSIEVALDRLAAVNRGAPLDSAIETARVVAERERLSGIVVILSAWDARRAAFVEALATEGVAVLVVVVGDAAPPAGATRFVEAAAVLRGESVAL